MRLHKSATILMIAMVICFAMTVPTVAQQIFGGHDETSEVNNGRWATGAPTPGATPALTAVHLLLSEFAVTGTPVEFLEIYNPTAATVYLDKYYVTDAWYVPTPPAPISAYYQYPSGSFLITTATDFCVRFPSGASIASGATLVIAMYGQGIDSTYGAGTADYEVTPYNAGIPDMINVGGNVLYPGGATLTNGSEFLMLFYWDGLSDNVCDVDYVTWGTSSGTSRVDKTGLTCDGPDAGAIATVYKNDTPIAAQSSVGAPGAGLSSARSLLPEGVEAANGNGCTAGGPTPVTSTTWGQIKTLYR